MSAVGPILEFQAAREAANAERQAGKDAQTIAEFNAKVAEQGAREEELRAITQGKIHREQTARIEGANIARAGKSGITLTGSPLHVLRENAKVASRDNFLILREGKLRSNQLTSQASLDRFSGNIARKAGSSKSRAILLSGKAKLAADAVDIAKKFLPTT